MSSGVGAERDRVVLAVAGATVLALVARLVALDARPFHWDEARVGYWTLRYVETGTWSYRPVAGGPLLYHLGAALTGLLGASDAVARLPVAVLGGLLPLAALLFRTRLDDGETVALAVFLGLSPLLVYFSRFLRGDVLAAGFALVALGALVRTYDGAERFAPLAGVAAALSLGASGFAVAYPVAALVAGAVVVDHDRVAGRPETARARLAALRRQAVASADRVGAAALLFFATALALFAPRPFGLGSVTGALVDAPRAFVGVRIVGRSPEGTHELLPYLADALSVVVGVSLPLTGFALYALFRGRYGAGRARPLVGFAAYWGLFGLFLFPVVAESFGPWVVVHALVVLALPAAVGAAAVVRTGARALDRGATREAVAVGLVLLAVVAQTGAVAASEVYAPPEPGSDLATYGQAADDLDPVAETVAANGGRVLLYGDDFVLRSEDAAARPPVPPGFAARLPLAWYLERADANVTSAATPAALSTPPPVVIATASARSEAASRLENYESRAYHTALWNRRIVVFVRR
ncbi:MAG: flippase activity-associated protein Agl23 [Haloferacaceae archaeon]